MHALLGVMKEKYSYIKGPSSKQHPELYDNLTSLQNLGLTIDELGRLYVNFLFENKPGKILAKLQSTKGGPGLEKAKRIIKKEIQKDTRHYFSEKKNNLEHDGLKPEEIIPDNDLDNVQAVFDLYFKKGDTIETVVNSLMEDRKQCFQKIGSALIEGTERYDLRKKAAGSSHLYKLFLEYDGILRALKRKEKDEATTIL
jgi:hypothetical protein